MRLQAHTSGLLFMTIAIMALTVGGIGIAMLRQAGMLTFADAAWLAGGFTLLVVGIATVWFIHYSQLLNRHLQRNERRLSGLLHASPVGVYETDHEGNCIFISERWCEITGIPAEQAHGRCWQRPLHPEDMAHAQTAWQEAIAAGSPFHAEYRIVRASGETIWVLWQAVALQNGDPGQPSGHVGSITDINQLKLLEQALRRSEANLADAQRIAHIGNWVWDIKSGSLEWTDEVYRIFGFSAQEFPATYESFLQRIHPDDRHLVTHGVARALDKTQPYSVDHRVVRPDGRAVVVHEQGEVFFDATGKAVRMIGTVQDITLQKDYEEQLEQLNDTLEQRVKARTRELLDERNFNAALLETVGALVVVLDDKGRIVRFNQACVRTTGFSAAEVQGRYIWDALVPPEQVTGVRQVFSQLTVQPLPNQHENEWLTKSGERRLIAWSNSTLQDEHGTPLVIGTGIDITHRKQMETALLQAKEQAEQASRVKSEFLSRMSHELRTPMNAVLGFSQLLEADARHPLSEEQAENVQEILKAGYHLLDLINEILDLTHVESGRMTIQPTPLCMAQAVEEASRMVAPQMQQREINLIKKLDGCDSAFVMADKVRLRQVLVNLLSNAVKYNRPAGSILLACEDLADRLRLNVTDTGHGIEPAQLSNLFLPFERLGAEFSMVEGTGIGLALSKQLMELMAGSIGAGSTPGEGSTFWIELPKAIPA